MIRQTYLFFADIYFLYIINNLLFEAVGIVILFAHVFFELGYQAFLDFYFALGFQFKNGFLLLADIGDAEQEIFFERFTFFQPVQG